MQPRKDWPQIGDKIEVRETHRFAGRTGRVVGVGTNPYAAVNHFEIRFDEKFFGPIGGDQIWLGLNDFLVYERVEE